jgi:hypothetical protein
VRLDPLRSLPRLAARPHPARRRRSRSCPKTRRLWRLHTHPGAPFAGSAMWARHFPACSPISPMRKWKLSSPAPTAPSSTAPKPVHSHCISQTPPSSPQKILGESPGASALQQTIIAAMTRRNALVTVVGINHQAGAARVEPAGASPAKSSYTSTTWLTS